MGQKQRIRDAAPALYEAARAAFLVLCGNDPIAQAERHKASVKLRQALMLTEDVEDVCKVKLTVTNKTAALLHSYVAKRVEETGSSLTRKLQTVLLAGTRPTKRRVFITFDAERDIIQHMISLLEDKWPGSARVALERIIRELKAADKSPLLWLAEVAE